MDNDANHYKPVHPLPEEIQNLSRDDTICKFCGVSYLIHNEIKRMEEKLQEYRNEINRLEHFNEREKILKEEVSNLNIKSVELVKKWEVEEKRYNEMCRAVEQKDQSINTFKKLLADSNTIIKSLECDNYMLKQQTENLNTMIWKLRETVLSVKTSLKEVENMYVNLKNKQLEVIASTKKLLGSKISDKFNSMSKANDEIFRRATVEKEKLAKDLMIVKKKHIVELDKLKKHHMAKSASSIEKEEQMMNRHNEKVEKQQNEYDELMKQFEQTKLKRACDDEISAAEIEKYKKEISNLNDSLKRLQNNTSIDKKNLLEAISASEKENEMLKVEREKMIDAHQHRIQQLRESFLEKLKEAEKWPVKLENELAVQQRKFNSEKTELLKEVTESYEKVIEENEKNFRSKIEDEKKKFQERESKLKLHIETIQDKFHKEVGALHTTLDEVKKEKENINLSLNKKISDSQRELQKHLNKKYSVSEDDEITYKRRINELNAALQLADAEIRKKNATLQETENEMHSLRECVRRECEERYELTESLAQARTELLSFQRYYGNNNSSKQKLVPNPPLNNRKSSLHNSDHLHESRTSAEENDATSFRGSTCSSSLESTRTANYYDHENKSSEQSRDRIKVAMGRYSKNKLKISMKNNTK